MGMYSLERHPDFPWLTYNEVTLTYFCERCGEKGTDTPERSFPMTRWVDKHKSCPPIEDEHQTINILPGDEP